MFAIGAYAAYMAVIGAVCTMPDWFRTQMNHAPWEGFTFYDLIMPLFLFIVGTAMPFSLGKRLAEGQSKRQLYIRVVRRVLLLWVLGMIAQGHLLECNPKNLQFFSNTLQAIAVGYLVASVALIHLSVRWQFLLTCVLLLGFWLLMMLVSAPGCPAGTLKPEVNLARYVDEFVLRGFRDQNTYTWILSGLGFSATVLLGVLSGHILRTAWTGWKKTAALLLAGAACLALGWVWAGGFGWLAAWRFPIIKHIWTSSMVLWSAGWCYLLLALFYLVIDVLGFRKWSLFFMVIGANAITAYMLPRLVDFNYVAGRFVGGLAGWVTSWGGVGASIAAVLTPVAAYAIVWLILYYMYRKGSFVRV